MMTRVIVRAAQDTSRGIPARRVRAVSYCTLAALSLLLVPLQVSAERTWWTRATSSSARGGSPESGARRGLPAWGSGPTLVLDQLADAPGLDDRRSVRLVRAASGEGVPKALDPVVALQPAEAALMVVEGQTATFFVFQQGTLHRQVTLGKPEDLDRWTQAYLGIRLPQSESRNGNSAIRLASISGQPQLVALLREPAQHADDVRNSSSSAPSEVVSAPTPTSNARAARRGAEYATAPSAQRPTSIWWTNAKATVRNQPAAAASTQNPPLALRTSTSTSTPRVDPNNPLRHLTVKAVLNSSDPLEGLTDDETRSD